MTDDILRSEGGTARKGLTRRQLLAGMSLGAIGVATAGLSTGCTANASEATTVQNPTVGPHVDVVPADSDWAMPAYSHEVDETIETDLLCIGSGLGGFSCGLTALQMGVKNVIIIDGSDKMGGNTAMAEGLTAINTPWMREAGFENLDPDTIIQKEFDWHHYICDSTLWRTVLKNNDEDFNWLLDQGVKIVVCVATGGADYPTHHVYEGHRGSSALKHLLENFTKLGGQLLLNTRATHMLMDGDTVQGVQCLTADGCHINIKAKAVELATGGAGGNKDLINRWTERNADNMHWQGSPYIIGDGIQLAVESGMGKPYHLGGPGLGASVEPLDINSQFSCGMALESCNMWVNQDAVRFFNEGKTLSFYAPVNAIESQCFTYSINDSAIWDHYINDGCDVGWAQYVKRGSKLTKAMEEGQRELDSHNPFVFKADTLEELAEQMGLDVEQFMKTVEEYNEMCRNGKDTMFFKDAYYLRELKQPPFWGARLKAGVVSQKGGVHCNSKGEVIKMNGKRINGLYVAGLDCGGFQSQTTGITIPGSVQGYALGMGRQCARHATAYINNEE